MTELQMLVSSSAQALTFLAEHLAGFLVAAGSAFAGAFFAFALENRTRQSTERDRRHGDLMAPQVRLIRQCTTANAICLPKGVVSAGNPFENLKEMVETPPSPVLQIQTLWFVGEGSSPSLLMELHAAQQQFQNFQSILTVRNRKIL